MKLNKNTQIILGVGALAVVGYFVWKSTQKDDTKKMVGATGYKRRKRNASGRFCNPDMFDPRRKWCDDGMYYDGKLVVPKKEK